MGSRESGGAGAAQGRTRTGIGDGNQPAGTGDGDTVAASRAVPVFEGDFDQINDNGTAEWRLQSALKQRGLTDEEIKELDDQVYDPVKDINGVLRSTSAYYASFDPTKNPQIVAIDAAMRPLERNAVLRKYADGGLKYDLEKQFKDGNLVGARISDKGYNIGDLAITTPSSNYPDPNKNDVKIIMRVPKGTPTGIPSKEKKIGRYEILVNTSIVIHRNSAFKVTNARMVNGRLVVEMDYDGYGD